MRRVDREDSLLSCREAALGRLCAGGRRHGRGRGRESRVVNGWLLLRTGQMDRLGRLVLMVLNRAGCRMASTVLAGLLSGGGC